MPSLHKDPRGKSPYWYCAYTLPDGRRTFRSTKCSDKKQAKEICRTWSKASLQGDKLTTERAREIIAAGVADVMAVTGEQLPGATIRVWTKQWLDGKALENEQRTHERYEVSIRRFVGFLGGKADKDLSTLRTDDVLKFRDNTTKSLSITSTNMDLKVLRSCLYAAVRQDLLQKNVAANVSTLKQRGESKRRAFTVEEIGKILRACEKAGGEWKGLVLAAAYTGQRLGDICLMTWNQIDLDSGVISFVTAKTGKRLGFSLAKPLLEFFHDLPSADHPDAYVFPGAAQAAEKRTGTISTKFYDEILVPAGLVSARPRKDKSTGKGRDAKRTISEVSFHSFRHTFTTWLKSVGASNAMAQMIVGHDSEVVSRGYTHLTANETASFIHNLPDVTAPKTKR
jgi:integrase